MSQNVKALERYGDFMAELCVKAYLNQLDTVLAFVTAEAEAAGLGMKDVTQLEISVEEIFVNIAHYAYEEEGAGNATISVYVKDGFFTVSFEDSGKPFDPLAKEDPDISLSAEERQIGGLGIYMVKKYMDDVFYEYKDNKNILIVKKKVDTHSI